MGGFARYPWPQYISNAPFYYNKHYKRAMLIAGFAMIVNSMWVLRFTRSHTVFLVLYRWSTPATAATSIQSTPRPPNNSK